MIHSQNPDLFDPDTPMTPEEAKESIGTLSSAVMSGDEHFQTAAYEAYKLKQNNNWKLCGEYDSWEDLCKEVFGTYRQAVDRKILYFEVIRSLPKSKIDRLKQTHIIELAKIPPAQREEVLRIAYSIAPVNRFSKHGGKTLGAKHIKEAYEKMKDGEKYSDYKPFLPGLPHSSGVTHPWVVPTSQSSQGFNGLSIEEDPFVDDSPPKQLSLLEYNEEDYVQWCEVVSVMDLPESSVIIIRWKAGGKLYEGPLPYDKLPLSVYGMKKGLT